MISRLDRATLWLLAASLPVLLWGGCGKKPQRAAELGPDVIARVEGTPISAREFNSLLQLRAGRDQNQQVQKAGRTALLEEMIEREALYAKAKAAGFDQLAEVRDAVKQVVVNRFREAELSKRPPASSIGESEIEEYYSAHQTQYLLPAKVHGAMIFLRVPGKADADKQAELKTTAQAVFEAARAAATPAEFAQVVQTHSEDQGTRYRGGDLGWTSRGAPPWGMDPAAVEALFALQNEGDFAPLISTEKGFYILKLLGLQPAGVRPLEQVRESIRHVLARQKDEQRDQAFYAAIKGGLNIRTNFALLNASPGGAPADDQTPPSLPGVVAQSK